MTPTLNIGLTAYHAVGNLAFVKVPSERGRYMLVDLCVIAVPCPVCGAVTGEPCRKYYGLRYWNRIYPSEKPMAHGAGVHVDRKVAADRKYGRGWKRTVLAHYKLHLGAGDIEAAMATELDPVPPAPGVDVDFPVTKKQAATAGQEG